MMSSRPHDLLQTYSDAAVRRAVEGGLSEQAISAEYIAHSLRIKTG